MLPAIGVDLGGSKIEAIALTDDGAMLARERVPTPAGDYAGTVDAIRRLVRDVEQGLCCEGCSIGIGTPGTTTHEGRIKNANSTSLNGQPLQRDLEAALGRSVRLANDANCLALSEATDGAGAGADVVFAVILGTGVGGGLVVHGQLLTGPNGLAGEWGHNPLPWAGTDDRLLACYCGRRGCIETFLSGPALARDHEDGAAGGALPAARIAELAAQGDARCDATLARYESRLARALASAINFLDPDVIVLGGGVSNLERLYVNVPRLWSPHVFSAGASEPVRTRLVRSMHGDSSGVRGAAWLGRR
jgi:fructokinase